MEAFNTSMPMLMPFTCTFTAATTTTSSYNNVNIIPNNWMDSRIWRKLPQNLLDRVIAFLPPPAFFRARCVCKRWYALLYTNSFLQLYIQVAPRLHWFLFFKQKSLKNCININKNNCSSSGRNGPLEGYLFDPYEVAWYRIYFNLVPSGFSPAASSGGLVCWISNEAGTKSLILCNPLLGSVSQLPQTIRQRLYPSIGFLVNPGSIDVTVAGDDLISPFAVKNLTTESFHIDARGFYSLWGTTSSLPRLCSLESGQMIHVNGKFYCMNYGPYSVLAYDIASNMWSKIQAPMRRFLRSPSLVESSGRLILVAAVEKSKLNVPKSLRLWCLQPCGTAWVEIERMPTQLYKQFADLEADRGFDCVGHGEFLAIMIRKSDQALLFDIYNKMWQWIPPCPYIHGGVNGDDGELHGFAFEPRLATPVTALLEHMTQLSFQPFNG